MHTGFWSGNLKERGKLGRPKPRWEDNIKINLKRDVVGGHGLDSYGSGWRRGPGCCKDGNEIWEFYKVQGITSLDSQRLHCMKLVSITG